MASLESVLCCQSQGKNLPQKVRPRIIRCLSGPEEARKFLFVKSLHQTF